MVTPDDFYELGRLVLHKRVRPSGEDDEDDDIEKPVKKTARSESNASPSLVDGDIPALLKTLKPLAPLPALPVGTSYLVFDTETSGRSDRAVVVQMAMAFIGADHRILAMYNHMWRLPYRVFLSKGAVKVHGISAATLKARGVDARAELVRMNRAFREAIALKLPIIAFNAAFDCRLLKQTAKAHNILRWDLDVKHTTCTYQASRIHSPLRNTRGARRGFRNGELYVHLFGCEPQGDLHDAATDVLVTAACYARGCQRRWW